jgi:bacterioferritin-associated ferredoxin
VDNSKNEQGKLVCRCEEVTEEEVLQAIKDGAKTLREIKMITRAGMGLCQGRTCSKIISRILAEETGISIDKIEPAGYRPPLRPIAISVFAKAKKKIGKKLKYKFSSAFNE